MHRSHSRDIARWAKCKSWVPSAFGQLLHHSVDNIPYPEIKPVVGQLIFYMSLTTIFEDWWLVTCYNVIPDKQCSLDTRTRHWLRNPLGFVWTSLVGSCHSSWYQPSQLDTTLTLHARHWLCQQTFPRIEAPSGKHSYWNIQEIYHE